MSPADFCMVLRLLSLVKLEGRKEVTKKETDRPFGRKVLCVCDGVFLLTNHNDSAFALWNPLHGGGCTKFHFPYKFNNIGMTGYGLCYDPTDNDLKVVLVSLSHYAIYSCKSKSWTKRREFPHSYGRLMPYTPGVSIDGAVFWIWESNDDHEFYDNNSVREIIYIDHRNDYGFKFLQKPKDLKSSDKFGLSSLGGCLCLYIGTDKMTLRMWIMEKGGDCWKEMTTVENIPSMQLRPVCFVEENKIMFELPPKGFMVYCPFEKNFGKIEENNIEGPYDNKCYHGIGLVPFVDSLIVLVEGTMPKRKRYNS